MFKILILSSALILLTAAAQSTSPNDNEVELEIQILNETVLEKPSYRIQPIVLRDKVYAVNVFTKVNWFVAQQICNYQGMTLASINSALESERLQRYLLEKGLTAHNENFWISGTDLGNQFQWIWFSNGLPFNYQNWRAGEPDNLDGSERCLQLLPNGQWNDLCCDTKMYFICENRCALTSYEVPIYPNF